MISRSFVRPRGERPRGRTELASARRVPAAKRRAEPAAKEPLRVGPARGVASGGRRTHQPPAPPPRCVSRPCTAAVDGRTRCRRVHCVPHPPPTRPSSVRASVRPCVRRCGGRVCGRRRRDTDGQLLRSPSFLSPSVVACCCASSSADYRVWTCRVSVWWPPRKVVASILFFFFISYLFTSPFVAAAVLRPRPFSR